MTIGFNMHSQLIALSFAAASIVTDWKWIARISLPRWIEVFSSAVYGLVKELVKAEVEPGGNSGGAIRGGRCGGVVEGETVDACEGGWRRESERVPWRVIRFRHVAAGNNGGRGN